MEDVGETGGCTPGYEGCACTLEGVCLAGLTCASMLCVDLGAQESSTGAPLDTTTSETTGTTAPVAESSTSESAETESTSEVDVGSSSSEASGTTEIEPVCPEGDNYCDMETAMHQTCVDGQWQVASCVEHCNLVGYDSPGCANTDSCTCVGFIDDACADGALGLCYCADVVYGVPCDMNSWIDFYDECFLGTTEYAVCWIDYPYTGGGYDCDTPIDVCL